VTGPHSRGVLQSRGLKLHQILRCSRSDQRPDPRALCVFARAGRDVNRAPWLTSGPPSMSHQSRPSYSPASWEAQEGAAAILSNAIRHRGSCLCPGAGHCSHSSSRRLSEARLERAARPERRLPSNTIRHAGGRPETCAKRNAVRPPSDRSQSFSIADEDEIEVHCQASPTTSAHPRIPLLWK
jgi:hypothetical protein